MSCLVDIFRAKYDALNPFFHFPFFYFYSNVFISSSIYISKHRRLSFFVVMVSWN